MRPLRFPKGPPSIRKIETHTNRQSHNASGIENAKTSYHRSRPCQLRCFVAGTSVRRQLEMCHPHLWSIQQRRPRQQYIWRGLVDFWWPSPAVHPLSPRSAAKTDHALARQRCRLWHANSAAETQAHELTAADLRLARRRRADQPQASVNVKALGLPVRAPQLPPAGPWLAGQQRITAQRIGIESSEKFLFPSHSIGGGRSTAQVRWCCFMCICPFEF